MDRHANLFRAVIDLYTVLVQLAVYPSSNFHIPDGPDANFNTSVALEAGFSEEAARIMSQLPYLDTDGLGFTDAQIMPDTYPAKYIGNLAHFEWLRSLDTDPDGDEMIPGSIIRLTTQDIYGIAFLYDTETGLMKEWKPFDGDPDVEGFHALVDDVPAKLPTEVLGPWTEKYRKLVILKYPKGKEWGGPFNTKDQKRYDLWLAVQKLRDLYLECGWDIDSMTQDGYDRDQFLEKRDILIRETIQPASFKYRGC